MAKSRYLLILFDQPIQAYEIPYFRAAVIEKSRRESDLFHNHIETDKFIYRYPLIQYKVTDRRASLICLNEATDDIHYLLKQRNFDFRIGKNHVRYEIEDVHLKYERIETGETDFRYNIHNWIALNQEHFAIYQTLDGLLEKIQFLEDILHKHVNIFLEEMKVNVGNPLRLKITELKGEKYIEYKKIFHLTFSVNIKTNLSIPNYVGLGKGVSVGFGIVKKLADEGRYMRVGDFKERLERIEG